MFGPGFHDLARSMEGDQGTAFVEFRLRDGLISDIEASGRSLLRALDKRGVEVPDDMRSGLHLLNVTVNYSDLGEPVTLKAPPRSRQMTTLEMEAGRCHA